MITFFSYCFVDCQNNIVMDGNFKYSHKRRGNQSKFLTKIYVLEI